MRNLPRELVKLLDRAQEALVELDRLNIATARTRIFELQQQLRELIKFAEQIEQSGGPTE